MIDRQAAKDSIGENQTATSSKKPCEPAREISIKGCNQWGEIGDQEAGGSKRETEVSLGEGGDRATKRRGQGAGHFRINVEGSEC